MVLHAVTSYITIITRVPSVLTWRHAVLPRAAERRSGGRTADEMSFPQCIHSALPPPSAVTTDQFGTRHHHNHSQQQQHSHEGQHGNTQWAALHCSNHPIISFRDLSSWSSPAVSVWWWVTARADICRQSALGTCLRVTRDTCHLDTCHRDTCPPSALNTAPHPAQSISTLSSRPVLRGNLNTLICHYLILWFPTIILSNLFSGLCLWCWAEKL